MADSSDSPRTLLENQYALLEERVASGAITESDAELLAEFGRALDENRPRPKVEIDGETRSGSASTVRQYLIRLRRDVAENGHELASIDAETFNDAMADLDADRARSTTQQAQSAAKLFYGYHSDLGVDADELEIFETDSTQRRVEPRSLLRPGEVEALRDAIDQTQNPLRNRALLELMIYTGQRIRALQTLQVGDVEVDEKPGAIYLNDDVEGLKGAEERGRYRPLTAARAHVRDWLKRHPRGDDPEAWLFVGAPSHPQTDLDRPWHTTSMRGMLKRAAVNAGIQDEGEPNRVTPHAFRHYWYTHMRMDEGVDPEKLKAAGGWSKNSNTPEQIYQNFADEELMDGIAEDLGLVESETVSAFIPDLCPSCGEPLEAHWDRCPVCNEHLRDDLLRDAEEDTMRDRHDSEDRDQAETLAEIQRLILEDPERVAAALGADVDED